MNDDDANASCMKSFKPILFVVLLLAANSAFAWGPHSEITLAAVSTLGTNHPLARQLGSELLELTNYCWLPDFKRLPFRVAAQDFYADDYLLFPGVTKHFDHICPEVQQTYEPYLKRALQALRMESPANAARWIGSLLHFVEDTGSPPHAAQIRGDVHAKMENWVDAKQISIAGYQPQLLGTNDNDAVRGLVQRMNGLIEFSKARGQKLRTPVLLGNRRAVEPVVLESALETARVSADVLHTLGTLAAQSSVDGFEIGGVVQAPAVMTPGRFPARIVVHGTNIATLADSVGRFVLRGLKARDYRITVIQPGAAILETNIPAMLFSTNVVFALPSSGNLIRNSDFSVRWVQAGAPDCWTKSGSTWEGEILALQSGQRYRVCANFMPDSEAEVLVRWSSELPFVVPKPIRPPPIQSRRLTADEPEFFVTGSTNAALMHLTLRTAEPPTNAVRSVAVIPVSD